jgi:inosose dehydratase
MVPLGEGDVEVDGVLAALNEMGYDGWLVVEQDMIPESDTPVQRAADEQRRNREYLHARGI